MSRGLSKTRLMSFRQCPRRLWLEANRRELAAAVPGQQAAFDHGHAVGEVARRLYDDGNGVMIELEAGLGTAMSRTREVLAASSTAPIFEATVERDGLLVRADVLERRNGAARLVEVKASTSVKPEHVDDCAIQAWTFETSPAPVTTVVLAHVDSSFVYAGDGNYRGLLTESDLTKEVAPLRDVVPGWLQAAKQVLAGDEPMAAIGTRCFTPYECPFQSRCWPAVDHPLTDLPRLGARLDALLAEGFTDLRELPESMLAGAEQERVWRVARSGQAEFSPAARDALVALDFPRFYLDFETIGFAVPRWAGTRPYQQLPFQFSLHIEHAGGRLEHVEYLDLSGEPPARPVARALIAAVGDRGPVFMYSPFERSCIRGLAASLPDLAAPLAALEARLVDLKPIAKRHYYHPAMHGSWSIKALLPTIAPELDYGGLGEVQEGTAAQQAYFEAIAAGTTSERREALRKSLLAYCRQDTLGMVAVARFLEGR